MWIKIRFCLTLPWDIWLHRKLDEVGPVDNRPSTNLRNNFVKKKYIYIKNSDLLYVTCDMWPVTHDIWYVTCDTLWGVNILTKFQLPSSYGLKTVFWKYFHKGSVSLLINYKGVCRSAPATPGLLITTYMYWTLSCKVHWTLFCTLCTLYCTLYCRLDCT